MNLLRDRILAALRRNDLSAGVLAERLGVRRPLVHKALQRLEASGAVVRVGDLRGDLSIWALPRERRSGAADNRQVA